MQSHEVSTTPAEQTDGRGGPGDLGRLEQLARQVRAEVVRLVSRVDGGHPGGSLSVTDLIVALYFAELRIRPDDPMWPERDRFVLSKGHASEAFYATLSLRGFFPSDELDTYGRLGSRLQGHPDMTRLAGVDISTGSLGLGLSAGIGMAMGFRLQGGSQRVYVILGDGECQEGSVWEAIWVAARNRLSNLVALVDFNSLQQTPWPAAAGVPSPPPWELDPLARQWKAAGWEVLTIDGHDHASILSALDGARAVTDRPTVIIASTVKGKGVSFMEADVSWHSRVPTAAELSQALEELGAPG